MSNSPGLASTCSRGRLVSPLTVQWVDPVVLTTTPASAWAAFAVAMLLASCYWSGAISPQPPGPLPPPAPTVAQSTDYRRCGLEFTASTSTLIF